MTIAAASPDRSVLAFSHPSFRFFRVTTLSTSFAAQIMSVLVGWQIYDLTRNPLYLGLIGLAQFLPALLLMMMAGLAANKFRRRRGHATGRRNTRRRWRSESEPPRPISRSWGL